MKLTFNMPAKPRAVRDVIASYPRFVAVDAEAIHCATRFIIVEPGTSGYNPVLGDVDLETADAVAMRWGAERAPTQAEREAALIGSMMGWSAPGADPANYSK